LEVGDVILLTLTEQTDLNTGGMETSELRSITAISSNTLTLNTTLTNFHYGAAGVTIEGDYTDIDMRAVIKKINRKINIVNMDNSFGCRVATYEYTDSNDNIQAG
jgi:hypothetical protein